MFRIVTTRERGERTALGTMISCSAFSLQTIRKKPPREYSMSSMRNRSCVNAKRFKPVYVGTCCFIREASLLQQVCASREYGDLYLAKNCREYHGGTSLNNRSRARTRHTDFASAQAKGYASAQKKSSSSSLSPEEVFRHRKNPDTLLQWDRSVPQSHK
jgi:hypothetical protein